MTAGYYKEGFLHIQRAVDLAIIKVVNQSADTDGVLIFLNLFPDPPERSDAFTHFINDYIPILTVVSFIILSASICKELVLEKEKKLKVRIFITIYRVFVFGDYVEIDKFMFMILVKFLL